LTKIVIALMGSKATRRVNPDCGNRQWFPNARFMQVVTSEPLGGVDFGITQPQAIFCKVVTFLATIVGRSPFRLYLLAKHD
jgi:hypothetical protein